MSDLSGVFCFHERLQGPAFSRYLFQLIHVGIMHLVKIDIVCAQIPETCLNIQSHGFFRSGHGFCRQNEFISQPIQAITDIFLADSIAPGRIDIIDALLRHLLQEQFCSLCVDSLNGNPAESHSGNTQSCFSQRSVFHISSLSAHSLDCTPASLYKGQYAPNLVHRCYL